MSLLPVFAVACAAPVFPACWQELLLPWLQENRILSLAYRRSRCLKPSDIQGMTGGALGRGAVAWKGLPPEV